MRISRAKVVIFLVFGLALFLIPFTYFVLLQNKHVQEVLRTSPPPPPRYKLLQELTTSYSRSILFDSESLQDGNKQLPEEISKYLENVMERAQFPAASGIPQLMTIVESENDFKFVENLINSVHNFYERKIETYNVDATVQKSPNFPKSGLIHDQVSNFATDAESVYWMIWSALTSQDYRKVIICNVGMSEDQVKIASKWRNVQVVKVSTYELPEQMKKNLEIKTLILYLLLQNYHSVLYLDPRIQLRENLDDLENILNSQGYVQLTKSAISMAQDGSCTDSVIGFVHGSNKYDILVDTLTCQYKGENCKLMDIMKKAGSHCSSEYFPIDYISSENQIQNVQLLDEKAVAVVIPFLENQLGKILGNLIEWNEPQYAPCGNKKDLRKTFDLIFYMNKDVNQGIENTLIESLSKKKSVTKCFRQVRFLYAHLNEEKHDKYPFGPTNQFFGMLVDNADFYTTYSHFLYLEPDVKALRPFWLEHVTSILKHYEIVKPDFWVIGSQFRGGGKVWALINRFHVNGNALYTTDASFRYYMKMIRDHAHVFDMDPYEFLLTYDNFQLTKHVWNRMIFHEFIQNWYRTRWPEKQLRKLFPRTYLIHGGYRE
ncbi:predicted protein [Naegleria gruberi]|uniref:Predicted protein n=1 Tax=Naegleria gruberi TaxID=5762 RepID=D2VIR1_NAEGR|nr:uncharacterized protein NAEGRDRAFT_68765 [Naegleria gruberi]EFC43319.1 predicted protein [Naegleria gruberi]|eukprot:XP_002676063.1 predicted protein [Naegleria gruberi strain NEG-M]